MKKKKKSNKHKNVYSNVYKKNKNKESLNNTNLHNQQKDLPNNISKKAIASKSRSNILNNPNNYIKHYDNNEDNNELLDKTRAITKIEIENVLPKKEEIKEVKKKLRTRRIAIIALALLLIVLIIFIVYSILSDTFKDEISVEIVSTPVTIEDFFDKKVMKNSEIITDLSTIDFNKLGDYEIEIKIGKKIRKSTMHLIDTTAPKVEFKDVEAYTNYIFNPNDFIVSAEDLTEVKVEALETPTIDKIGEYKVTIVVKDTSNNEVREERTLFIGFMEAFHQLELGDKLTKEDILFDINYKDAINQTDIDYINKQGIGDYEITAKVDGKTFTSKISVKDTKGPDLTLKNVTIYNDENGLNVNSFIKKVTDASKFTTSLKTEISYGKVGTYQITIEAVDEYGNITSKDATLSIIKDTVGPVISGLTDITINKNGSYDYQKNVKAIDAKDGAVSFTVDTNSLNINQAGIYYISYVAIDNSGNKTTKKRKVSVNPDQSDINNKVKSVASTLGNSVKDINKYVNTHIHYANNWGGTYPVWYGLTNFQGNCYVYANVLKALLDAKGYQTKLIWVNDKSHHWVMVYDEGKWWHSDAQCDRGLVKGTDKDMLVCTGGREWDRSAWPEA